MLPAVAAADFCWVYTGFPATNPQPWVTGCGPGTDDGVFAAGSTAGQLIGHEHRNWHCGNCIPGAFTCATPNTLANRRTYGRAFLAFHRQFILDFDNYRTGTLGIDRLEIWDPFEDAMVPGDDENFVTAFTHCSDADVPSPGDNIRAAGDCGGGTCSSLDADGVGTCSGGTRNGEACTVCRGCDDLPSQFIGGNLASFATLGDVGYALEANWHGSYHNGVLALGCDDIGGFLHTSRDPAFWMAHKKLDEVARNWQSLQATDVVIVLDRSGSMDDNCPGGTADPGESPCALNDAREAARTFANLVLDGAGHRIGLVSFASTATDEIGATGLVSADGIDTNATFQGALNGISAGGATSIGAGVREALAVLGAQAAPNPHQAILVLTDGKENTTPCLGGNSPTPPCPDPTDLTSAEVGQTQIVAVGFGAGAEEPNLRDVAERHGGIFVAEADVSDPLSLQKFFVTAFGHIFDGPIAVDPRGFLQPGQAASEPFEIPICADAERLSVALGHAQSRLGRECALELELFTPSGNRVDRKDPGVQVGGGERHDFLHVPIPYQGEGKGVWTGRVVRPFVAGVPDCETQEYFYSVLVKGFGRVEPFNMRPQVRVGQRLKAGFRISESNRPAGGFDAVNARVTLTRPGGATEVWPLVDDGTNGDRMPGNHIWSVEIPTPALEPGPHHLRAQFDLEEEGCRQVREAEYSVVVQGRPDHCTNVGGASVVDASQWHKPQPGDRILLDELFCVFNQCASRDQYELVVRDTRGWLRTLDPAGGLTEVPGSFFSGVADPFHLQCFGSGKSDHHPEAGIPLYAVIPPDARPGDRSIVSVEVRSMVHDQVPRRFETTIQVFSPLDCNTNGIPDHEEIASGEAHDEDRNGVLDKCQPGRHFHDVDEDLDGHLDPEDNCRCIPNEDQCDTDRDGIGNRCDGDLNGDGRVGIPDFNRFRAAFGSCRGDARYDPNADLDCGGCVGIPDFALFRPLFGQQADGQAACFEYHPD
ncbi:MAG: VWA domain-containing protein [Myxococcota bacterium]|nr:VWA domain-containing protein [Myxococcota bacterium]